MPAAAGTAGKAARQRVPATSSAAATVVPNGRATNGGNRGGTRSIKTWILLFGVVWLTYLVGVVFTVVRMHQMGPTTVSDDRIISNGLPRGFYPVPVSPSHATHVGATYHKISRQSLSEGAQAIENFRGRRKERAEEDRPLSPNSAVKKAIQNHVNDRKNIEGVDSFPNGGGGAEKGANADANADADDNDRPILDRDDNSGFRVQPGHHVSEEALEMARQRDEMLARQAELQRKRNLDRVRRPRFKPNPYGHMVNPQTIADHSHDRPPQRPPNRQRRQLLKTYSEPIDKASWKIRPLPLRQTSADKLVERSYPKLNSCRFLSSQWPVDEYPDDDPFLPWIHDVFPTHEGDFVQFVAQNKRRCRTGTTPDEEEALQHWEPQTTQFQHVPVKRVNTTFTVTPRYRLSSHEEADADAMATRFICRFKDAQGVVLEETLSVFNNDYEWATLRKKLKSMFSPDGRNLNSPHTSQLIFKCPVPRFLQDKIRTGESVVDDWATIFVDLVTIRTPPRYGPPNEFLVPEYELALPPAERSRPPMRFDPHVHWGDEHILPTFEDSGRWENIPICRPSLMEYEQDAYRKLQADGQDLMPSSDTTKAHYLVSCLWASTGYTTRGNRYAINDGQRRMLEWITYNQLLGFDHFYIYDNSGAFTDTNSLEPIADLFPGKVTVIPWPSKVCNNNPNNVDSPGERSSQYAAETSCRLRFGPHVNWIGQFDIDEYLVPMGNHDSILPVLDRLDKENMKIISFASWRAWPRHTHINTPVAINDKELCESRDPCFELTIPNNVTVLGAYNCDRQKPGQKTKQMPAEKQIYKADYVKQHFVHYSTITESTNLNVTEFRRRYGNTYAFPDPLSRFGDEVEEGLMLHSKAIARQDTAGWLRHCNIKGGGKGTCRIGYPWPDSAELKGEDHTPDGWKYNCYANKKIDTYWVPRLEAALARHSNLLSKA